MAYAYGMDCIEREYRKSIAHNSIYHFIAVRRPVYARVHSENDSFYKGELYRQYGARHSSSPTAPLRCVQCNLSCTFCFSSSLFVAMLICIAMFHFAP